MASPWQRRVQRAQELLDQHAFAAEILSFYIHIASFQENLQVQLENILPLEAPPISCELSRAELSELAARFESFLSVVERHGSQTLAKLSKEFRPRGPSFFSQLLSVAWTASVPSDAPLVLAQAFLQPYAELLRGKADVAPPLSRASRQGGDHAVCPFCLRKPAFGLLRQMGEGAARSMVCSFCMAEWDFRRLVCPGCGDENDKHLAVFTAGDFDYIRVECCETCKTYIKTIDLTRNGRAEPIVDELVSAPLDLWAREHGYAKLHANLLGM